jgi:IPT/TIG domain
MAGPV